MRCAVRTIDRALAEAVGILNRLPGVLTRTSCQGMDPGAGPARHAALAYVLFRFPLPLRLQEFMHQELADVARVEDDGIHCRWPDANPLFVRRLTAVARAYAEALRADGRVAVPWPLARLRARVARAAGLSRAGRVPAPAGTGSRATGNPTPEVRQKPVSLAICLDCRDLVDLPHPPAHRCAVTLDLPPQAELEWFTAFVAEDANALDPQLVAAAGWERLLARARAGDFGAVFRRRWLRYRSRCVAQLSTWDLRRATATSRAHGQDVDFYYDGTHAVCTWEVPPAATS